VVRVPELWTGVPGRLDLLVDPVVVDSFRVVADSDALEPGPGGSTRS
jgi:hypothetical protein